MRKILVGLLALCSARAEDSCPGGEGEDGTCKNPHLEGEASTETSSYVLPACKETFELEQLAADSAGWCNANLVPEAKRAPKKLQGLFWLKGLPLDDVAACFGNGEWDEQTLTLKVVVWKDFMFMDSSTAVGMVAALYHSEMAYLIKFADANLTDADIKPTGNAIGHAPLTVFGSIASFPMNELPAAMPGEKWARPSYFGVGSASMLTNEYEAWRILDGDLKVNHENVGVMLRLLGPRLKGMRINRFHLANSGGQCGSSAPVSTSSDQGIAASVMSALENLVAFVKSIFGAAADEPEDTSVVACGDGVLLVITGQPVLGVRYLLPKSEATHFARESNGECSVSYALLCEAGVAKVQETNSCDKAVPGTLAAGPQPLKAVGWEHCHSGEGSELRVEQTLLHQTWETEIPQLTKVEGCVGLRSAGGWPELKAASNDLEKQRLALIAQKKAVGGCPFFRSAADREARGQDFGSVFGVWLRGIQHENGVRAEMWGRGVGRWGEAPGFRDSSRDKVSALASLAFLGGATEQNRTTAFSTFAEVNCGEPAPFADGPQVFRHADVAAAAADPHQVRGFATATVEQSEICFDPTLPLFQSSGTPEHNQVRKLLDEAGFDRLHEKPLPEVEGVVPFSVTGALKKLLLDNASPGEKEVGAFVVPLVMEALWEATPSDELVKTVVQYLDFGKICIFGKKAEDLMLLNPITNRKILRIRKAVAEFGLASPRAEVFKQLIDKPEYAAVKAQYEQRGRPAVEVLVGNVADAMLFAGVLGTTDMTTKCVQYTHRDKAHLRMFRKNPKAFLHEVMRFDGAVTSFTTASKEEKVWKLEGRDVVLPAGAPVQMVLGSANRDEAVFSRPATFDPDRSDANENLAWNGRLGDTIARNYTGAPRFCPGYHVSVEIAAAVCQHLTADLHQWGAKPALVETGSVLPHDGTVRILRKGSYQQSTAQVSYVTQSGQYCLVDMKSNHKQLGCYEHHDLETLDRAGGFSRSLDEEMSRCPPFAAAAGQMLANAATNSYMEGNGLSWLMKTIVSKHAGTEQMTPDWAGPYLVPQYAAVLHIALRMFKARHADSVKIPKHTGKVEEFKIGKLSIPGLDIDYPEFLPIEAYAPKAFMDNLFLPSFNCFQAIARGAPFDDLLDDDDMNQWHMVLENKKFARKRDWVRSWYDPYVTLDGDLVWPEVEIDFAARFLRQGIALKADEWSDGLEKAMAFDLIGPHRVRSVQREFGGETLPYVIELNDFKDIPVRPHFGKYGCDMYFTEAGIPALIVTTDGREVARGDKDWQYWKFAWRSSFLTLVTLIDHLHMTHFRGGSSLAKATRATLSPDHPMRRFLSVFTFGTIFVNLNAAHTLIGPEHTLHRAGPFEDFTDLGSAVPTMLEDPFDQHAHFRDEAAFEALPLLVQSSPYFADGKLLYGALDRLVENYVSLYEEDVCDAEGHLRRSSEMFAFGSSLLADYTKTGFESGLSLNMTCSMLKKRLTAMIWVVTGWHRHVGTVGDYYVDPDLAAMSWKEGEAHSRPLQHMILTVIASFTGTKQPKLIEDYTHVFKGIEKEQDAMNVWRRFTADLELISKTIAERNEKRDVKNFHTDPRIVECSVAV